MHNGKIVILCPEIVPMDNKGEEAIIRGVMDSLNLSDSICEYHIVDPSVKDFEEKRGLFLHPKYIFFDDWRTREYGFGFSFERIYSSFCAILRHLLYILFPSWVKLAPFAVIRLNKYLKYAKNNQFNKIPEKYRKSIEALSNVDYIIAGHNGGLNEDVCHVLSMFKNIGIKYSIYGSCMKPKISKENLLNVYKKAFENAEKIIIRNPIGYDWFTKHFKAIDATLAPDPAFAMNPISNEQIETLMDKLDIKELFSKPVLMVTTAEPAPISQHAFDKYNNRISKIKAHREFMAEIIKRIHSQYNINILFLPHTIGPTANMDDRAISKDILSIAKIENSKNEGCYVLENDLSASELKGLISKADMLLAERVHSVIGAIGVHTPILCLASKNDTRVDGMLKNMAGLKDYIYYLNNPNVNEFMEKFNIIFNDRKNISKIIKQVDTNLKNELKVASLEIKSKIEPYEHIN